jgi:hypothetical protein
MWTATTVHCKNIYTPLKKLHSHESTDGRMRTGPRLQYSIALTLLAAVAIFTVAAAAAVVAVAAAVQPRQPGRDLPKRRVIIHLNAHA